MNLIAESSDSKFVLKASRIIAMFTLSTRWKIHVAKSNYQLKIRLKNVNRSYIPEIFVNLYTLNASYLKILGLKRYQC